MAELKSKDKATVLSESIAASHYKHSLTCPLLLQRTLRPTSRARNLLAFCPSSTRRVMRPSRVCSGLTPTLLT